MEGHHTYQSVRARRSILFASAAVACLAGPGTTTAGSAPPGAVQGSYPSWSPGGANSWYVDLALSAPPGHAAAPPAAGSARLTADLGAPNPVALPTPTA